MGNSNRKPLIILPTVNEGSTLATVIQGIFAAVPQASILVVDDNSTDDSREILAKFQKSNPRVHALLRPAKLGLASAYLAGFQWGLERDYDTFVQMDADLSHLPEEVSSLINAIPHPNSLVIGSRYVPGGSTPGWAPVRRWISRVGNLYARIILSLSIKDSTGGMNIWTREALQSVLAAPISSNGYCFQIELKYRASRIGVSLVEFPITFHERIAGRSKMNSAIIWEAIRKPLWLRLQADPKTKRQSESPPSRPEDSKKCA